MRAWHLDLIIGALGRGPDFEILLAVVRLFRLLLLGLIGLLLLLHFSLNLFLLLLSKSVVSNDTLAFEKRLNVNTTYIFVHGTDLTSAHDFLQLFFSQIYYDVLGFEVGVNDTTLAVEIVKPNQDLLSHAAHKWQWDPFVVIAFHYLK